MPEQFVVTIVCDGNRVLLDNTLCELRREAPFGYAHAKKSAEPRCIEVPRPADSQQEAEDEVAKMLENHIDEPDRRWVSVRRADAR